MKTQQKLHSLGLIGQTVLLVILLFVSGCQGQKQGDAKTNAVSDVTPPEVDLHTAVISSNLDAIRQHIAAGSNLNEKDPFGGSSPLITAAVFGKTEEARILIDAGADLNFQNNDGSTALHTSAFFCRPEIVRMLLQKGADKAIKNKFGATAYESVLAPFSEVKGVYDMMSASLGPMGLKLDYAYVEKTRPEIADLLK